MKHLCFSPFFPALVGLWLGCIESTALAQSPVIVGKNDWLFVRHEIKLAEMAKDAQASMDLIQKFNRVLARQKIALVVVMVPSKMETYAEQLPDDLKISSYMAGFNDAAIANLRRAGVHVIDLKKPMREAALNPAMQPQYFRLDTHWTPTGAMTAAQSIHAGIMANPELKKAWDAASPTAYNLKWMPRPELQKKIRDITQFLPAGTAEYPPESVLRFRMSQPTAAPTTLLGAGTGDEVSLVGSSFSGEWLSFPDALRYTVQRNVLAFSVSGDRGHWATMLAYLQNDAFQVKPPKLLIWEMPERVMSWRPSYRFLRERFQIDDAEWLLQVTALGQGGCEAMPITARIEPQGSGQRANTATQDSDFIELSFDKPVDQTAYLSARVTVNGSPQLLMEAFDRAGLVRRFTLEVPGDDAEHALKTPLSVNSKGVSRLRIYPGQTKTFALTQPQICRYLD